MVIDSVFNIGDTAWTMIGNKPTECQVTGFIFDSGVIGCDGNSKGIFTDSFYKETTVKYYVIKKSKVTNGDYDRIDVEKKQYYIRDLFPSKVELVNSLL